MNKMKNYRIDFAHNTIVVDYKFDKAAQIIGSTAYEDLKKIRSDFPTMTTRVASHREQKRPHQNRRLTYENMIKYMMTFDNSDELLVEFTTIQEQSYASKNPYSYVRKWFIAMFPNYSQPVCKITPKASFKSIEKEMNDDQWRLDSTKNNLDSFNKEISQNF